MTDTLAANGEASLAVNGVNGSRSDTSMAVILGAALLLTGLLGLPTYIGLFVLPTGVCVLLMLIVTGACLLASEVYLDDPVICGMSLSQLIAQMLGSYRDGWSRFLVLLSCPDAITAEDVEVVAGGCRRNAMLPCAPTTTIEAHRIQDAFDAAVHWLQRPALTLSLPEQVRLRILHDQVIAEGAALHKVRDAADHHVADQEQHDELPDVTETGPLLAGLCNGSAPKGEKATEADIHLQVKRLLPVALAEVDPTFASAHKKLAIPTPSLQHAREQPLPLVTLRLLERRLPPNLDEKVMQLQRALFCTSVIPLAATLRYSRRSRIPKMLALSWMLYTGALSTGLPAGFYVLLRMLVSSDRLQLMAAAWRSSGGGAMARFLDLLARVFLPRVSPPLLAG